MINRDIDSTQEDCWTGLEIAVTGMAGRFPGAGNLRQFWENLKNGVESISFFSDEELQECGINSELLKNPNYIKAKGFIENVEYFDALFFNYSPREAEIMDPQIRVLQECAWRALEDAGCDPWTYNGAIGLYVGASANFNWVSVSPLSGGSSDSSEGLEAGTLCYKDAISTLTSYKLNLKGPSFALYTACSTSLVAIHLGCRALLMGECGTALAGGVSISYPKKAGYLYHQGMLLSPDGHCRTFDAEAEGTVFSDGAGVVALKRLENALTDGDHIYAVIKASVINNDGERKIGYTAPSVEGQAEVIRAALHMAEVNVESIGYIETHGTGTRVGDPIEIEALKKVFNTDKKAYCGIGTVKTNIGHLDTASGAASFIKTVLALNHRLIPATLNFERPNPAIDFVDSAFYVNAELTQWSKDKYPLRAGVSAFGFGGTNVHIILEEAPGQREEFAGVPGDNHLIILSAKTGTALEKAAENLKEYFIQNPGVNLAGVAYTLQLGRRAFEYRRVELCADISTAVEALSQKKKPGEILEDVSSPTAAAGNLWVKGQAIDWNTLYKDQKTHRVPLPGYPFEGKRFWIAPTSSHKEENMLMPSLEKQKDIADWFYVPQWELSALSAPGKWREKRTCWLIFIDMGGIGLQLKKELEKEGDTVIAVKQATGGQAGEFIRLKEGEYLLDPRQSNHYHQVLEELRLLKKFPHHIIHMWNKTISREVQEQYQGSEILDAGFYSLVYLAQAIGRQNIIEECGITVITDHMQTVIGTECIYPEKAAVLAPCKSLPQEYPNILCRSIDIDRITPGSLEEKELLQCLLAECRAKFHDTVVAYRDNRRWVLTFKRVVKQLLSTPLSLGSSEAAPQLRQKGVYLITGGLGLIGTRLARYLAEAVQAKLVLTGRRSFPNREQWKEWSSHHLGEKDISRKIQNLQEIESLGAEVLVVAADVADKKQMQEVINQAEERFGKINGLIHAAGFLHSKSAFSILERLDRSLCEKHFQSKMMGLKVLEEILTGKELDFCLMISSLSPILGGLGFAAYAAANLFMDAYVLWHNKEKTGHWITVNWGDWQPDKKENPEAFIGASLEKLEMNAKEGIKTFQCVLALKDFSQLVISAGNLQSRINQWIIPGGLRFKTGAPGKSTHMKKEVKESHPNLYEGYQSSRKEIEKIITDIWLDFYRVERVEKDDNFFDLGANSLDLIQIHTKLIKTLGKHISFDVMFEYPTIRKLADFLSEGKSRQPGNAGAKEKKETLKKGEIAVIGMAGRFPGARDTREFWENLKDGRESISFFADRELEDAASNSGDVNNSNYIKAKGYLEDIEYFDLDFFEYSARDAETIDPQVRIFHECVWNALEDAGYDPFMYDGPIGLYAGASPNLYWQVLSTLSGANESADQFANAIFNDKDSLTTMVSYKLNLKGPSSVLFTGCSTSLVAIDWAVHSLLSGQCQMAVAGGVTIVLPGKSGYIYQEGMLFSSDGHCRSFDEKSSGIVFGDAVGAVVLKPLEKAAADGDFIYAVIKGSAVNNDGNQKPGYTSPSIQGQVEVIEKAQAAAGIEPESIGYIETHGTATRLGDPIEVKALIKTFNTEKREFCRIGSVKSNVGHLMCAAGVAGFIKTVLALRHQLIPPSLNFQTPNIQIDFENSPFLVNTKLHQWKEDGYPLRAGVSSFGIGGTNAHVVLERYSRPTLSSPGKEWKMIMISAKTREALERNTVNLAGYFQGNPDINLADAAYTLQVGRHAFKYRRTLVCKDTREAARRLTSLETGKVRTFFAPEDKQSVVFMFAGQGGQYTNMGRELYEKEPLFRQEIHRCFEILAPIMGFDSKEILYPSPGDHRSHRSQRSYNSYKSNINQTEIAQPVIFVFEYALAKLLMAWGITPSAMIGYSFGEYLAAHFSGVFSLEDALKLVSVRAQLMGRLPGGAMLSVPLPENRLKLIMEELEPELSLAIVNGPSCIVAGSQEAIGTFEKEMKKRHYLCMPVPVSHGVHSLEMDSILGEFEKAVRQVILNKPGIPYISNITGDWIRADQAGDPAYWVRHLRETVRFADGINELSKNVNRVLVEIGPGRDLSVMVKRFMEDNPERIVSTVPPRQENISDLYFLLTQIAHLWRVGVPIDWRHYYGEERRVRISLPAYSFERRRCWTEGNPFNMGVGQVTQKPKLEKIPDVARWFYLPQWNRTALSPGNPVAQGEGPWLVFANNSQLGNRLVNQLKQNQAEVIIVRQGPCFNRQTDGEYLVNPSREEDYYSLFRDLFTRDNMPRKILHLWNVENRGKESGEPAPGNDIPKALDLGFYSLLYLAKAIGKEKVKDTIQLEVVTDNMQEVIGDERLCPEKAPLLGVMIVLPQEYPYLRCRNIDIVLPEAGSKEEEKLIQQLLEEFFSPSPDIIVAYRSSYRWVQIFEPIRLESPAEKNSYLRKEGVYLITGGLGGIGFIMAKYLAVEVQARLILTGRTQLPPAGEWNRWLSHHGQEENKTSSRILKLQELETLGADVLYFSADTADEQQMAEILRRGEKQWGPVNGVIHAAGVLDGPSFNFIRELKKEDCQEQFQSKIYGVLVLEKLLKNKDLDFCLLMSSIASVLGGLGYAAYSGANLFMDAFVYWYSRESRVPWLSVDWSDWHYWEEKSQPGAVGAEIAELSMTPGEGITALERILTWEKSVRAAISPGDLHWRIRQWIKLEHLEDEKNKEQENSAIPALFHARPDLLGPYIPPRYPLEQTLVNIWNQLFKLEQLGICDDFFKLGGDSLKAVTVALKIYKELNVEVPVAQFFKCPTIEEMAHYIKSADQSFCISIETAEKKQYYPLSFAQKRIYLIYRMEPESTAYNESQANVMIEGKLDTQKVEKCLCKVMKRHECYRTAVTTVDNEPVQVILEEAEPIIEYYKANEEEIPALIRRFVRPFDLTFPPFVRVGLIEVGENSHILMVDMHHIITDGISQNIFIDDLIKYYADKELPPLKLQYKDFACWQKRAEQRKAVKKQEEYWLKEFSDELPVLHLPTDFARPAVRNFEGDNIDFELTPGETAALNAFVLQEEVTLFIVLLAVYTLFLSKISGQEDIIVGVSAAGRSHADLDNIIGVFVNTVALRNYPSGSKIFKVFLKEVKQRTLQAFANQDYQFDDLLEKININRDLSRNPLFDVMFTLQNQGAHSGTLEGIKVVKNYSFENKIAKFDLNLNASQLGDILWLNLEYSTRLFKRETIQLFIKQLKNLLQFIPGNGELPLEDIEIISDKIKQEVLQRFTDDLENEQ